MKRSYTKEEVEAKYREFYNKEALIKVNLNFKKTDLQFIKKI